MEPIYERSIPLLTDEGINLLRKSHVAIFGLGGVGGHTAEALCRSGIGTLTLIDSEKFDSTNLNRQIFATEETVGFLKVDCAKKRLLTINPQCQIHTLPLFFDSTTDASSLLEGVDYIIDAIDSVSSKLFLIECAKKLNIPIISSMGTGNKLDPCAFRVSDLYKTKVCPLARVMRSECKKRGIDRLKVVYSEETPIENSLTNERGKRVPCSVSFVPGVAGMILAGETIKDLIRTCIS